MHIIQDPHLFTGAIHINNLVFISFNQSILKTAGRPNFLSRQSISQSVILSASQPVSQSHKASTSTGIS